MEIIQIPKQGTSTVSMILAKTGSRFENPKVKGISHFVEHLCFKGSKKYTQKQITLGIERFGGILNAFTDYEITAYHVKTANNCKEQVLDILQDFVLNPIFPIKEISKERKVIIEELKMGEDNPQWAVGDYLNETLYKESSGLYLSTIGTRGSLKKINKKALEDYHKENYEKLTLIRVGDVKEKSIITPFKEIASPEILPDKRKRKNLIKRPNIAQANVIIANYVNLMGMTRMDRWAIFKILMAIYNGMSGRLFQTIREKNNLVYGIHFSAMMLSCGGIQWEVSLGLEKNKINKAYDLVVKELTRPIEREEVAIALTKLNGLDSLYYDNNYNLSEAIAYALINGLDYKEILYNSKKHYEEVAKDIGEYQKKINFSDNIMVGIIPSN